MAAVDHPSEENGMSEPQVAHAGTITLVRNGERQPDVFHNGILHATPRRDQSRVERYVFAVLRCDGTIADAWSIALLDPSAMWTRVAELAGNIDEPGGLIRVTNEAGGVLILVGIALARHSSLSTTLRASLSDPLLERALY